MDILNAMKAMLGMPVPLRGAVRSGKWPKLRTEHLAKWPACTACGNLKRPKEVHHVVPVHFDPGRELDPENLITFCADDCHITWGHLWNWKLQNVNVLEDCARFMKSMREARTQLDRLPMQRMYVE